MMSDEQKFKLAIAWYYDAEDWEINKAIAVIEEAESIATAPLLARIAELEAGDEEALEHQEWWNSRMLELERENAELVKALEEARKDAEMYRWLRDRNSHYLHNSAWIASVTAVKDGPCEIFSADEVPALLDAEIERRMTASRAAIKEQT